MVALAPLFRERFSAGGPGRLATWSWSRRASLPPALPLAHMDLAAVAVADRERARPWRQTARYPDIVDPRPSQVAYAVRISWRTAISLVERFERWATATIWPISYFSLDDAARAVGTNQRTSLGGCAWRC